MNTEPKKRKFSRSSTTWQLFNKFFFLDSAQYPFTTPEMPRGSAINLVQGLNCCNIQWAEEQAMPLSFLTLSAKAKSTDLLNPKNPSAPWVVEISANQRHGVEGRKRASSSAWMQSLLALPVEGEMPSPSPSPDTASSSLGDESSPPVKAPSSLVQDEPSHFDKELEAWMKGGEGEAK